MSFEVIDTRFMGIEQSVACHRYEEVLIDPGPAASIHHVIDALGDVVPTTCLLTHIHLDHAGGTGALIEHFPEMQVYIHEVGLPHMVDPSRLLASAARVYGDELSKFGETLPVPAENIHAIAEGDVVEGFEALDTPGHSNHHMAFFHLQTEMAIVGDLVGQTVHPFDVLLMSSPPPEIDIEAWIASIDKLATHDPAPSTLGLAHFGRVPDVIDQLDAAKQELRRIAELGRDGTEEEFMQYQQAKLARVPADIAEAIATALPLDMNYAGLVRYWDKKSAGTAELS